jgi:hypothetical protein
MNFFRGLLDTLATNRLYTWWTLAVVIALSAFVVTTSAVQLLLWSAFLVTQGAVCWYGYRQCGRAHCRLTGPAFIAIGFLMIATAITSVLDPHMWHLEMLTEYLMSSPLFLTLVAGVIAVAFAYEGYVTLRTGTPYCRSHVKPR